MIFNTVTFAALFATAVSGLVVNPTNNANDLAKAILGSSPGIKLVSASYAGAADSSGTYTDGPQGIRSAAVLTSGNAVDTVLGSTGANADVSKAKGTPGSPLCSTLAGGATSFDAAVLTMNVELQSGFTGFFTEFVFATEEYPEYIGKEWNDVMGIYVDGKQIAFDGTGAPITINGPFFKSDKVLVPPASGSNFDGSTPILKSGHVTTTGAHKIEIAICDIEDRLFDSSVFVTLGACTGECKEGTAVSPCAAKGGDSDNDGICDNDDNCPTVFNPNQDPAACMATGTGGLKPTGVSNGNMTITPPKYGNTTLTGGASIPCVTLTSMTTQTITTCTAKTICHPTTTVKPVVYTSVVSVTVTTPCSTFTVTRCPDGSGSPCKTYVNTVTLAPVTTWSQPPVTSTATAYKCPGGTKCSGPSVSVGAPVCPGGPNCPVDTVSTHPAGCPGGSKCPVATTAPVVKTTSAYGCPGGVNCPPPAVTTGSVYGCPGGVDCPPPAVTTGSVYGCPGGVDCPPPAVATGSVYGCPGGAGCPPVSGPGNKTSPVVPQYTGAADRVGAGAAGVVGLFGALAALML